MTENNSVLAPLDGKSSRLFLVAGGLLIVFATLLTYEAFTNTAAPEDIFGPPGFFLAMVGLLGLYPGLADRAPRLARASAVVAALSALGWFGITVLAIGETAGVLPPLEDVGMLGLVVALAAGIPMILAYILFSAICLRTDVYSRTLGLLVLAPVVIFGVMIVGGLLWGGAVGAAVLSSGQAISHLAIGYVLRSEAIPTERGESPVDATA